MNRVYFNHMANKISLDHQRSKFFNITQFDPEYYESERQAAKIKQAKERLNLDGKINHIIYNVHEQLREQQSSPKYATTEPNVTKIKSQEKVCLQKRFIPHRRNEINNNLIKSFDNNECNNVSFSRMKVQCSDKERVHKSTETPYKCITYENHKRMMLAVQRQNELENMIREHKLLTQDRQSLEQDIFAVRHSLDDLQHRVNNSLRELTKKKTYCECHGLTSTNTCQECDKNKNIS